MPVLDAMQWMTRSIYLRRFAEQKRSMAKNSKKASTFMALRNPVSETWFASVFSGTCVAAHDCVAMRGIGNAGAAVQDNR